MKLYKTPNVAIFFLAYFLHDPWGVGHSLLAPLNTLLGTLQASIVDTSQPSYSATQHLDPKTMTHTGSKLKM